MIVVACSTCHNVDLQPSQIQGTIGYCPVCGTDKAMFETILVHVETQNGNKNKSFAEAIQKSVEKVQR